jgi:hypothetical protein
MTSAQITSLKNEISTGPLASVLAPLIATAQDQAVADMLNDVSNGIFIPTSMPMLEFAKFAAGSGIRQKLRNGQSNAVVGAVCDTAIEMFGQLSIMFDPTDSGTSQMMSGLVAAGIISNDDVVAAIGFCTRQISRAVFILGRDCTAIDIGECR